jgi:HD-like signal output (HDOD) protein
VNNEPQLREQRLMSTASSAPTYRSGKDSVAPAAGISDEARGAALQFLTALAKEVSSGTVDLPCFPDIVIRIRNALADPSTTSEQTVTIVGAEPRLAARLLQTANSAAFNQSGKPLTDLRSAITRLGHQLVQSAAMAFAVQHMKNEKSLRSIAGMLGELWKQSIIVASICQQVAGRTKINPDEAFLTGLLHGIGRLYIMVRAVGKSAEFKDPDAFVSLVAGWHASIGKAVLENWGFDETMCEAIGSQTDLDRSRRGREADLADILVASIALSRGLAVKDDAEVQIAGPRAFAVLGLTAKECVTLSAHANKRLGSLQEVLGC